MGLYIYTIWTHLAVVITRRSGGTVSALAAVSRARVREANGVGNCSRCCSSLCREVRGAPDGRAAHPPRVNPNPDVTAGRLRAPRRHIPGTLVRQAGSEPALAAACLCAGGVCGRPWTSHTPPFWTSVEPRAVTPFHRWLTSSSWLLIWIVSAGGQPMTPVGRLRMIGGFTQQLPRIASLD